MTRDLLQRRDARSIRFFLLSAQYRHPLNYTEEALAQAEQGLQRIDRLILNLDHKIASLESRVDVVPEVAGVPSTEAVSLCGEIRQSFIEAMDDDFNTADGISAIFEGVRAINSRLDDPVLTIADLREYRQVIVELLGVIGIPEAERTDLEAEVAALIEERNAARAARNFARADEIRDALKERGIVLEDTPQGTRWSFEA